MYLVHVVCTIHTLLTLVSSFLCTYSWIDYHTLFAESIATVPYSLPRYFWEFQKLRLRNRLLPPNHPFLSKFPLFSIVHVWRGLRVNRGPVEGTHRKQSRKFSHDPGIEHGTLRFMTWRVIKRAITRPCHVYLLTPYQNCIVRQTSYTGAPSPLCLLL